MNDTIVAPTDVIVNALRAKEYHELRFKQAPIVQPVIDNVAVVFTDVEAERLFVEHAQSVGWSVFNQTEDHVRGHLSEEDYDVAFTFLRDPDDANFRIESMLVDGVSALHSELIRWHGQGAVAQGSYKPTHGTDLAAYQAENAFLDHGFVGALQLIECFQAGYGLYTYWKPYSLGADALTYGYLKVRLNTRDAS